MEVFVKCVSSVLEHYHSIPQTRRRETRFLTKSTLEISQKDDTPGLGRISSPSHLVGNSKVYVGLCYLGKQILNLSGPHVHLPSEGIVLDNL